MMINEIGLPFAVKCNSEQECLSFIQEIKELGFQFGGWKGHFKGDTFVWVNLHTKTWSYGMPGIKLCEYFCNKIISLEELRQIMHICGIDS